MSAAIMRSTSFPYGGRIKPAVLNLACRNTGSDG
jgi:hypothetical protein